MTYRVHDISIGIIHESTQFFLEILFNEFVLLLYILMIYINIIIILIINTEINKENRY